jgi:hypothetical protein
VDQELNIAFEPTRFGTLANGENGWLGFANRHLVSILVPVDDHAVDPEQIGWFLLIGFGPCAREGLLFPTLNAAEAWIRGQIPENWAAATAA